MKIIDEQILTKTDIKIFKLLIGKDKPVSRSFIYNKLQDKYPQRINDRIKKLIKYKIIEELDGEKRGMKKLRVIEGEELLITLILSKFKENKK